VSSVGSANAPLRRIPGEQACTRQGSQSAHTEAPPTSPAGGSRAWPVHRRPPGGEHPRLPCVVEAHARRHVCSHVQARTGCWGRTVARQRLEMSRCQVAQAADSDIRARAPLLGRVRGTATLSHDRWGPVPVSQSPRQPGRRSCTGAAVQRSFGARCVAPWSPLRRQAVETVAGPATGWRLGHAPSARQASAWSACARPPFRAAAGWRRPGGGGARARTPGGAGAGRSGARPQLPRKSEATRHRHAHLSHIGGWRESPCSPPPRLLWFAVRTGGWPVPDSGASVSALLRGRWRRPVAGPLSRAPWVFIVFPGAAVQPCQAAGSRCAAVVVAARSALGGPHHDPALAGAPTGVSQSPPGSPGGHRSAPADA